MNNRQKDDWYPTPPDATKDLLRVESFAPVIWEPACGDGAISKVLADKYDVISTDLNDYKFGTPSVDFLMETTAMASQIVTNPPYKLANEFILKAIDLGIEKHAYLLRTAFLEGQSRYKNLYAQNPPKNIWVFSRRLTMIRGDHDEAWYGSGKISFAWFIFRKGYTGKPSLGWL